MLYTGSDASPDSAAALIKDASNDSSTGVQRSGTDVTVDAATEKTLTLSQLTPATPYTFYAVLQDSAGNIGAVSNKLVITTADGSTVKYICENGTPQDGTPPGNDDVEECISCATGFTLTSEKKCLKDTTTPDFTLTVSTTTTASVVINGTVALSARVTNSGTAAADPTTLKWYSSPDATLDTGDTALGDAVTVAALAAGATGTALTTSVTAPATPGTVYYGACVTAIFGEATAANNCHSVAITVTEAPKADLTVAAPTAASTTVNRDTPFTLSTTVTNGGSAGAAPTNLQWYSSPDTTITTSDTPLGNAVNVAALNAGASSASLSSGAIGAPATPGVYYYGACVAAVNDEATTENNCSPSITITVPTIYTCSNGMPADSKPTGTADVAECKSCNSGFKLVGTTCVATQYTCPANGTAKADGKPAGTSDQVVCERCNDGFKLAAPNGGVIGDPNTTCVATQYTCSNGTQADGKPATGNDDGAKCKACDDGYVSNDTSTACDPNPNFSKHANGVTIVCTAASANAKGIIDGVVYTKRAVGDITLANATTTCTSGIETMTNTTLPFDGTTFNGDISHWDTSSATTMNSMFSNATDFNQDIGDWDTSNVTDMSSVFNGAPKFNHDIGSWDTGKVTNMIGIFNNATAFNQDIGDWNTSLVKNFIPGSFTNSMFEGATSFNQDLSWDVSNMLDMSNMFKGATAFNQDLSWDVSEVTNMRSMFEGARAFNGDISGWDVSKVTTMENMFFNARAFNQNIGSWDTSEATNMQGMFWVATAFNQDISSWNVSTVMNMYSMFAYAAAFNQNIGSWTVSAVTNMRRMFEGATAFNGDISGWIVDNVTDMFGMFWRAAAFNQDISSWNVNTVTNMAAMFQDATAFNQDLSGWCVSHISTAPPNFAHRATAFTAGNMPMWGADCSS